MGFLMHVVVVGAGIGGLTAALSLHAADIEVTVLESVREPRALGVGINLQPHAVREFDELGLGGDLARLGVETSEFIHTDRHGNRIWAEPRGRGRGYRWPQYSIHRGALQMLLLETARARLGGDRVRLGMKFEHVDELPGRVRARVTDRASGSQVSLDGDVLIGADGINSTVREQYHGKSEFHHVGVHMWRGVCEVDHLFLDGRSMVILGSTTAPRMVAYCISLEALARGRSLVNWLAEVPVAVDGDGGPDLDRRVSAEEVLAYFDGWGPDWLDAAGLIRNSPEILSYPMIDRDPLPHWGGERVTLLGDAAHPLIPVGSNGGSQAVIDARVLAHSLAASPDPVSGLARYQEIRLETANALVLATRTNPPDEYVQLVEKRAPEGFDDIHEVLTDDELAGLSATYERISHSDIGELNTRPSWTP